MVNSNSDAQIMQYLNLTHSIMCFRFGHYSMILFYRKHQFNLRSILV